MCRGDYHNSDRLNKNGFRAFNNNSIQHFVIYYIDNYIKIYTFIKLTYKLFLVKNLFIKYKKKYFLFLP